jgi:uncharacterized protein
VESFQEGPAHRHVVTGLERWFVLTWLAIYPLITAVFFFFGDPLQQLPLGIRTLVVTAIIVPAMIYLVTPLMTPLFTRWLYSRESRETEEADNEP